MYWDMSNTRRKRHLLSWHLELACEFLEALRNSNYWDRGHFPDRNELSEEDVTDEVVVTWAAIRQFIAPNVAHSYFHHRNGISKHDDKGTTHGHMCPPLFLIAEQIPKLAKRLTDADVERAKRDLQGFVGLKTAASRGKFKAEEVWQ